MSAPLWTAADAAAATGGTAQRGWTASGVSIDSRTVKPGDLFVALAGPNFDGHDFIAAAFETVLTRKPTAEERARCEKYLRDQAAALAAPAKLTPFPPSADAVTPPAADVQNAFRLVLDQAGSTGDTFRVLVLADAGEPFSGYSLALDYDETILTYRGFVRPDAFPEGKASFTLCPDANLQGCSGRASAVMVFTQATQHPKAENVLVGTFLFRKPVVSEAETTAIETGSNRSQSSDCPPIAIHAFRSA